VKRKRARCGRADLERTVLLRAPSIVHAGSTHMMGRTTGACSCRALPSRSARFAFRLPAGFRIALAAASSCSFSRTVDSTANPRRNVLMTTKRRTVDDLSCVLPHRRARALSSIRHRENVASTCCGRMTRGAPGAGTGPVSIVGFAGCTSLGYSLRADVAPGRRPMNNCTTPD